VTVRPSAGRKKPLIFSVSHGGYPFDVMVALGATSAEVLAALKKKGIVPSAGDMKWFTDGTCDTRNEKGNCTMLGDSGVTVIRLATWRFSSADCGRLAHEITHAVEQLFHRLGGVEPGCHCFAYAVQHLTTEIFLQIGRLKGPKAKKRR
jgi:hypothetical protein